MKKLIPLIFLFVIVLLSEGCKEEKEWMNQGSITGYDLRLCACCGGFFIEIDNETYRFYELPSNTEVAFTNETVFPVEVNIDWHPDENACLGDEIIVDEMAYL